MQPKPSASAARPHSMKRKGCCDACKRRHRKCVVQPGAAACGACRDSGRHCRFDTRLRFKHSHMRGNSRPNEPSTTGPISISFLVTQSIDVDIRHSTSPVSEETTVPAQTDHANTPDHCATLQPDEVVQHGLTEKYALEKPVDDHYEYQQVEQLLFDASLGITDPLASRKQEPRTFSPENSELTPTICFTQRQAFLFRTYVQKLAPSVSYSTHGLYLIFDAHSVESSQSDACDEARHFALEVPRLALQEPMILNGVLALASRYDAHRTNRISEMESTYYHGRCIELLIEALAMPPETWDSRILTAVVFARLYEEYDNESDSQYHHLRGTRHLLNHHAVAQFVAQGGLAEAASWVYLRQTIYVYLVRREPIEICLENFERSAMFVRDDDSAHANRIVYHLAKLLTLFFPARSADRERKPPELLQAEAWNEVETEIENWHKNTPSSFRPLYHDPPNLSEGRPFPSIWMGSGVPVVALQHYYAAKAILCLHKSQAISSDFRDHASELEYNDKRRIVSYFGILMGLALSNEHAVNAFYLPAHMLSLCGYCITHPTEREHTIQYLKMVVDVVQWKTSGLIHSLQNEWAEMDRLNGT